MFQIIYLDAQSIVIKIFKRYLFRYLSSDVMKTRKIRKRKKHVELKSLSLDVRNAI